jgi:hypothetical protein
MANVKPWEAANRHLYSGGPFDKERPDSMINLIPDEIRDFFLKIPEQFLMFNESQLERMCKPDIYVNKLRIAFWSEYERAASEGRKMILRSIQDTIGPSSPRFMACFMQANTFAYILCAPNTYNDFLDESLYHGMKKLREFLNIEIKKEDGSPDFSAVNTILRIVEFLDLRKHGSVVQRTQNLNVEVKGNSQIGTGKPGDPALLPENIDEQIKQLEARIKGDKKLNKKLLEAE